MSIHQHSAPTGKSTNGDDGAAVIDQLEALAEAYGNRFLLEPAPDNQLPEHGMRAVDAMRLIGEELVLDGIPQRNLATFVTTWMEPEAQRIIAENLHRNFIDHAEYPQTAEIEQRCIRMLASLFHAPGETTGARTQGSSEAIMLGALSLKWKWRQRREAARQGHEPAEPRVRRRRARRVGEVLPLLRRRAADHPAAARQVRDRARGRRAARRREHDRRRRRARHDVHGPRRRHPGHQRPAGPATRRARARRPAARRRGQRRLRVAVPVPATPSGTSGSSRCARSTSRATSSGSSTPGIGWLVFREKSDLAEDLVFYENYLGKTDATFTLNFSTGSSMVLAQYYNFVRYGHDGYRYIMETMQANARALAERIAGIGDFKLVGDEGAEQLPLVAFQLEGDHDYDEFDVASQLAAERGWMVPAYTLPPNADHVTIMRALVKLTLGHTLATTLADDIAEACETLKKKGGLHELDRKRVKTGTGY